jgi:membrane-associated phospholipid phosphatase
VIADLWLQVAARFRERWRTIPAADRRAWVRILAAGTAGSVPLVLGMAWLASRLEGAGRLAWEEAMLRGLDTERFPITFNTAMWLETPGNAVFLVPVTIILAFLGIWLGHPARGIAFPLGFALLNLPVVLGWLVWARDRPDFVAEGVGTPGGFFRSFPSGHVTHAVATYGLVAYLWIIDSRSALERVLALLVAVAIVGTVAVSRLRLGAHWPTDVIAATVLGLYWLAVTIAALRRAAHPVPTPTPDRG